MPNPARLGLDPTKTAAFQDPVCTADILLRLRTKGFEPTPDDFGTGYSSIKLLKQLPVSVVKIDRSFVVDLPTSRHSLAIIQAIIDMARHLELQPAAEGVETEEVARSPEQLGIGSLQGYHIGRPVPVEALAARLAYLSCCRFDGRSV